MRNIRIRAWCHVENRMFIPHDLASTPTGFRSEMIFAANGMAVRRTLMLGSGVLDLNGVEIFEADCVQWVDSDQDIRKDTVVWRNGGLVLCNSQYTVGSYCNVLVKGNIFENPELMKEYGT